MKKVLKISLRILGILILVIFLAGIIIPSLFKEQIKEKVLGIANERIDASLAAGDFSLTIFRNFPNLTFRLKDVAVTGVDRFEGDTLAGLKSFNLVFDIASVISKKGYRIKAIEIDRPVANIIILEDGSVNYDIVKKSPGDTLTAGEESPDDGKDKREEKDISLRLNKFEINNCVISYVDRQGGMEALISDMNLLLKGNMSQSHSDLLLTMDAGGLDFRMGGVRYLKNASISSRFDIGADMQDKIFELKDNYLSINDLRLLFDGSVQVDDQDILTDINLGTGDTQFKSLLSLIPAVYMEGFEELETDGSFSISGNVKGRYSSADSLLPDVMLEVLVKKGQLSYPDLPEKISDIDLSALLMLDGSDPDNTVIDLADLHFILAGSPFDMNMTLSTPVSDPEVEAQFKGRLDLGALASAVPVKLERLAGVVDINFGLHGRMSMIENKDYDSFVADGTLEISEFDVMMEDVPPLGIKHAAFSFTPAYAVMNDFMLDLAGNKINLSGRLENYLPFVLQKETIKGEMNLYSAYIDIDTIFSYLPVDTMDVSDDTLSIQTIEIPENIDFQFISVVDRLSYRPLVATDIRGNLYISNGALIVRETGLSTLGADVRLNAEYDSGNALTPRLVADLSVDGLGIRQSFNTFNTVKKLAPVAEGMNGDISMSFDFTALLGEGMIPLVETIQGRGTLVSDQIQLLSSPIYEKFSSVLQIGEDYTNTFKDLDLAFEVRDGRVHIKPFDTQLGDMKITLGGDHGIDQSINYLMELEIPSSELPAGMSDFLTGLAASAALMGIEFYQPEIIRMDISIEGSVKDPVIKPSLGRNKGASGKETVREAAGELIEEKVGQARDQVSQEVSEQAGKIIAEAQKKADILKDEAALAAQKIRDEGEKNAQKLIDEAADRGALAKLAAERTAERLRKEANEKASLLEAEAGTQADKIMEEARARAEDIKK
ncbi:MAG: AsmA-like C-terminal region-containing protein [Bacteroidales bacterium]|jgi:hypothetical protein|nr:AsmA-like C-terminal region-containing protein [Bacteroidales bacterium]